MEISNLIKKLIEKEDLTIEESSSVAIALASPDLDSSSKKAFLVALARKGESVTEVTGFARTFRELARDPELSDTAFRAIDVVGTGGDHSGSFNISSTVALTLAAAGVPVFKHGNRSITSKCGSAEFLEGLGINIMPTKEEMRRSVAELNFCFFFAPAFHPAFKEIMPVRMELASEGQRTIFNILGPLINPGKPAHQLMGVFSEDWVDPLAGVLDSLGLKRGLVVHGRIDETHVMDEMICCGTNFITGFGELRETRMCEEGPGHWQLPDSPADHVRGGGVAQNVSLLNDLLAGEAPSGLLDTVCLNTGAALWVAGETPCIEDGISQAKELLLGGAVADWLARARAFYSRIS